VHLSRFPGEICHVDDRVFAKAIRAMDSEGLVNGPFGLAFLVVATRSHQLSLAQILKKMGFTAVGMYVRQLSGIGNPDEAPVFIRYAYRLAKLKMVKIAFYLILSFFDVYLSGHTHSSFSSTRLF
jgi:hypothetical protein